MSILTALLIVLLIFMVSHWFRVAMGVSKEATRLIHDSAVLLFYFGVCMSPIAVPSSVSSIALVALFITFFVCSFGQSLANWIMKDAR